MKRVFTLLLAGLLTFCALTSCSNDGNTLDTTNVGADTTAPAQTTGAPDDNEAPQADPEVITVVDAKASTGMEGDFKAAFAAESDDENVITGADQTPVVHWLAAALPSPTVITSVVLTAPTSGQELLATASIDASVDGVNWVTLKNLGSTITAGKTYTLNINDDTAYLYVRIRQGDEMRTQAFAFRTMVLNGIPQKGSAGDLSNVIDEQELGTLVTMTAQIASSTQNGNPANVFVDNQDSWSSATGTAGAPNWLISTMTKKTEIRKIVVKLWDSNRHPRGAVIQASTDGGNWVDLYTIEDLKVDGVTAESGEWTYYINDTTKYSFIRVVQRDDLAPYNLTLNTILIYGIESEEVANEMPRKFVDSTTVNVTMLEDHTDPHSKNVTAASIWDLSDKTTEYTHKEHPDLTARVEYWISGKFDSPTVITKIIYYAPANNAARARSSYFEASVDGVTWTKIATLPGQSDLYGNSAVITLTVDDDTAYNYIRLVQGPGLFKYYWTLGTVEVIGLANEET